MTQNTENPKGAESQWLAQVTEATQSHRDIFHGPGADTISAPRKSLLRRLIGR